MKKIEVNLDSTALGTSGCILNLVRTVIGDLPSDNESELINHSGAYRERAMGAALVYGIAVHKFIDTMFKTGGHIPTAKKEASLAFALPCIPDKKKPWLRDERHLFPVCYNTWTEYVEVEGSFDLLSLTQNCYWCKGTGKMGGMFDHKPTVEPCTHCSGTGTIVGPATEITFKIKYYEDDYIIVYLCGTIDSVGKFKNGCFAIRDWKTTSAWDNVGYFRQYEMSRQLRFYTVACKLMSRLYPDSILGKIGATNMGAFIDGVFLSTDPNETTWNRSDVYQFKEEALNAFQLTLDDKIQEISRAIKTGYLPKQGILNGACETKFPPNRCKFWDVCRHDSTVANVLLARDFVRVKFDPLNYNDL